MYEPRRRPVEHRLPIRGLRYRCLQWGPAHGRPVWLLHGWGDCAASFQFLADLYAGDCGLWAPDWRGFGGSEHAAQGYWFADYLADLEALLDAVHPERPVTLVGHSMGGNIAGLYAGIRPARVERLVLLEGFGLPAQSAALAPERYRQWLDELREAPGARRFATIDALIERIRARAPLLDQERARYVAEQWSEPAPDGGRRLRMDPRHRRVNPVLYRRDEAMFCWRQVRASVLAVFGGRSDLYPAAERDALCAELRACFSALRLEVLAQAGHQLHLEAPQALCALLHEQPGAVPG